MLLEYVVVFGLGLNQLKKPDFLACVDFAGAGFGACHLLLVLGAVYDDVYGFVDDGDDAEHLFKHAYPPL